LAISSATWSERTVEDRLAAYDLAVTARRDEKLWGAFTKAIVANPLETNPNSTAVAISIFGNAVRDMIVSLTQIRLLPESVMRIAPSDQPINSDLSYRAGRWIAVAIVGLAGASVNWRLVKRSRGVVSLGIGNKPARRLK
jgi:hypothetical protein